MDNSDEDTNGSFEFVDKVTDSSDSEHKSTDGKMKLEGEKSSENEVQNGWEDVLGSGHLLKRVIKKGGDVRPERRDICEIRYECRHDGEVIEKVDYIKVPISDCELIQGLDLIVPLMYVGEIAEVKVNPRFAYGSKGVSDENLQVPPDATLCYTVELLCASPEPELETLNVEERKTTKKKLRGNWWFSREDYPFAILCYKRALEYLDYTEQDNMEQSMSRNEADQLIDERINVYNNLSVAQLKVKSIDESLGSADTVLKLQPNNVKALFRKGKALAEKGERREAFNCFKKALDLDPTNKSVQAEMQHLQNLLVVDAKKERILYKKMFKPTKSSKELSQSAIKNTWIKLGIFFGSLAVAVVGAIVYKYHYLD